MDCLARNLTDGTYLTFIIFGFISLFFGFPFGKVSSAEAAGAASSQTTGLSRGTGFLGGVDSPQQLQSIAAGSAQGTGSSQEAGSFRKGHLKWASRRVPHLR